MNLKAKRHQSGRNVYWVVRVGKRFSGVGATKKRYFKSRGAANKFIETLIDARRRLGESAFTLTLEQQSEAVNAFQRLQPLGVSLTSVVDHYIQTYVDRKVCPTLKDFVTTFINARLLSCKPHTLSTYQSDLKPALKEFGSLPLNQIHQSDIEEWVPELDFAPRTCCNILDTMTTVFNDAVRKEFINRNPALFVPRPKFSCDPPGILTPNQAESLLKAAQQLRPQLVHALAIALFGGLRRSELCCLKGRNVIFEENLIEVPANVAKTRQRRLVTIRPNLAQWLADAPRDETLLTITSCPDVFGEWLRELAVHAGILTWPHNAMRHSFASYLYALIKNEGIVAAEMGNSPNIVIKHYRAVVRPTAAEHYFGITPPTE
jgi:integrase